MTFDEVFKMWLDNEVLGGEGRDLLPVAQQKGFTSVAEWRLATAIRLGMDKKHWRMETMGDPNAVLPNVIVGPYQGWSKFFKNTISTTFAEALAIPAFFEWCQAHDRIQPLVKNFPLPTSIILFQKSDGSFVHVEGGHRICAVAYRKHIGQPLDFSGKPPVSAAVADITEEEIGHMRKFLQQGTFKKK